MDRAAPLDGTVSVLGAELILLAVGTILAETAEGGGSEMVGPHA